MYLWQKSLEEFEKVRSPLRPKRLFEWLYNVYSNVYLSSVDKQYVPLLADAKTSLCIVDVSVDDACDNIDLIKKMGGEEFSYSLLDLLYNINSIVNDSYGRRKEELERILQNNESSLEYYRTTYTTLKDVVQLIRKLGRYEEFKDKFIYGIRNVGSAMEFSFLVNKEDITYPLSYIIDNRSASTMVYVHCILDLMASPHFDKKEVGKTLPLFKMADTVAMLSNTLNTWPREILEKDKSSPVIALGLERGIITFDELQKDNAKEVESKLSPLVGDIEQLTDKVVENMRNYINQTNIKSFDVDKFVRDVSKVKEAFKARERYWESKSPSK